MPLTASLILGGSVSTKTSAAVLTEKSSTGISSSFSSGPVISGTCFIKFQRKRRARGLRLVRVYASGAATHAGNLYVLVPFGFFLGTAIDFQIDGLLMESDVGDLYAIADPAAAP